MTVVLYIQGQKNAISKVRLSCALCVGISGLVRLSQPSSKLVMWKNWLTNRGFPRAIVSPLLIVLTLWIRLPWGISSMHCQHSKCRKHITGLWQGSSPTRTHQEQSHHWTVLGLDRQDTSHCPLAVLRLFKKCLLMQKSFHQNSYLFWVSG